MFIWRPLSRPSIKNGIINRIPQIFRPSSSLAKPPPNPSPEKQGFFSGFAPPNNPTNPPPFPTPSQTDSKHGKSLGIPREIMAEIGNSRGYAPPFSGNSFRQSQVETDADIVHVKILRNNTFITVTDSKGNRKFGATAGGLAPGGKVSRFAAESTAEHVGREARSRNLKSVVMKVNGFTYFKRKKQTVVSFKEGYNHSRGDVNPVVFIEDTTRRPHNGCRRKKQRRI